jgi:3,4-dihydroxy 2-butanone 4-phosphate synthase/GTP cyclohydrolase II
MCQFSVKRQVSAPIPTRSGQFILHLFSNSRDHKEHLALVMGDVGGGADVLVRVHSECFTGDVLGSLRCDCGQQLQIALQRIAKQGRGVLIYLRQEGRGIGLRDKLRAYNLQDQGFDTVEANLILGHQADEREYGMAACILEELGVRSVKLLTNNPHKVVSLRRLGVTVSGRVPLRIPPTRQNLAYLRTKAERMNHDLPRALFAPSEHPMPPSDDGLA